MMQHGHAQSVVEDAEDGTTDAWQIVDNDPAGAAINNVEDGGSRVIGFTSDGTANAAILGGINARQPDHCPQRCTRARTRFHR